MERRNMWFVLARSLRSPAKHPMRNIVLQNERHVAADSADKRGIISRASAKISGKTDFSVRAGIRRYLTQYLVEFGAVKQAAVEHYGCNLARVLDVVQGIRIQQNEVG